MMNSSVLRTISAVVLSAATSLLLVACGEAEIAKADVEQGAQKSLTAAVGKPAPPITCPSGLKAKVGTKMTCTMSDAGKTYDVHITVDSVEGTNAHYSVEVAAGPSGGGDKAGEKPAEKPAEHHE